MEACQHLMLPQQPPPGHVVQQVGMCVEYHTFPPFCLLLSSICAPPEIRKPFLMETGNFFRISFVFPLDFSAKIL